MASLDSRDDVIEEEQYSDIDEEGSSIIEENEEIP